jgi:hypothetical protein
MYLSTYTPQFYFLFNRAFMDSEAKLYMVSCRLYMVDDLISKLFLEEIIY